MTLSSLPPDLIVRIWNDLDACSLGSTARVCKRFKQITYGTFGLDLAPRSLCDETIGRSPSWDRTIQQWWTRRLWADFGIAATPGELRQPAVTIAKTIKMMVAKIFHVKKHKDEVLELLPHKGSTFECLAVVDALFEDKDKLTFFMHPHFTSKTADRLKHRATFTDDRQLERALNVLLYNHKRLSAKQRHIEGVFDCILSRSMRHSKSVFMAFRTYSPTFGALLQYEISRQLASADLFATNYRVGNWLDAWYGSPGFNAAQERFPPHPDLSSQLPNPHLLPKLLRIAITCDIRFSEDETHFLLLSIERLYARCKLIGKQPPPIASILEVFLRCSNQTLPQIQYAAWEALMATFGPSSREAAWAFQPSRYEQPSSLLLHAPWSFLFFSIELYLNLKITDSKSCGKSLLECASHANPKDLPHKWVVLWIKLARKEKDADTVKRLSDLAPLYLSELKEGSAYLENAQWQEIFEAFVTLGSIGKVVIPVDDIDINVVARARALVAETTSRDLQNLLEPFVQSLKQKPPKSGQEPPAKRLKPAESDRGPLTFDCEQLPPKGDADS